MFQCIYNIISSINELMSELGEKADRILELLRVRNTLTIEELKEKLSLENTSLLVFMHQAGLIELGMEDVRITGFGYEIITAE